MKKEKKPFKISKKLVALLACFFALIVGITTFAAGGGAESLISSLKSASSNSSDVEYTTKGGTWVKVDDKTWKQTDAGGNTTVTLIKNGDTWEYIFTVQDDKAAYYGWEEEVPEGYTISGKGERSNPAINQDTDGKAVDFTITNEKEKYEEPKTGTLKLAKVIAGDAADENQNFEFTVTLSSDDEATQAKLTEGITFGDINFKNGTATIYLKGGESESLTNIPVGVKYKITEKAADGYTTTVTGGTEVAGEENTVDGTIVEDTETTDTTAGTIVLPGTVIAYTNTKEAEDPEDPTVPTGSFKVTEKTVYGTISDEFVYSAGLTGLTANKSYTLNISRSNSETLDSEMEVVSDISNEAVLNGDGDMEALNDVTAETVNFTANAAGTAYVEFQLKNGDIAEFSALPIGSKYQIKQSAAVGYTTSYEITDEEDENNLVAVMSKKQNLEKGQELSTQSETLDANEKALITFTNEQPEPKADAIDITVTKSWVDNDNENLARPDSVTVRLYQKKTDSDEGDMIATALLDEEGGWTSTFKDIAKYQADGETEFIYELKEDAVTDYEAAISKDNNGNYTVVNTYNKVETGNLLLSKEVAGNNADATKEFRFDITVMQDDETPLTGSFTLDSEQGTKTGTIFFDEDGEGTISLKGGESAFIKGLPAGTKYTVKETKYTDWYPEMQSDTSLEGTITKDNTSSVSVKNTYVEKFDVTFTNTVDGSMGDKTKEFNFTLELTAPTTPSGVTIPETLTYVKDGVENTVKKENGVYKFKLAHGENIVFKDIPAGTTYKAEETDGEDAGYTVTCNAKEGTINAAATVNFKNTRNGTVPTLAKLNTTIPLALIAAAIAGFIVIFVKDRKAKKAGTK